MMKYFRRVRQARNSQYGLNLSPIELYVLQKLGIIKLLDTNPKKYLEEEELDSNDQIPAT